MRIQKVENLNKALDFLTRVKLVKIENIGGQDIESGTPHLILGLMWTIILRLQIGEIEGADSKNAKMALLKWCQAKTKGYADVDVTNFSTSWKNGLAFNALIHAHRSDLINFPSLRQGDALGNLNNAFEIADSALGIDKLLDAEDVAEFPDEKSIMTQLFMYYNHFAAQSSEDVLKQRLHGFTQFEMDISQEKELFEKNAAGLMAWIAQKLAELASRKFPNNVDEVKSLLQTFKVEYQQTEKPPWFVQKNDLETHLFTIQTQLRAKNRVHFTPTNNMALIKAAWENLEVAENDYAVALREALKRLEMLDKLAQKFTKKAGLRESWMDDTAKLLVSDDFGSDLSAVQDSAKRENALATEIGSYGERLQIALDLGQSLADQGYYRADAVLDRCQGLQSKWAATSSRLQKRAALLSQALALQRLFSNIASAIEWIRTMRTELQSDVNHRSVGDVEDLLKALEADQANKDTFAATTSDQITKNTATLEAEGGLDMATVTGRRGDLAAAMQGLDQHLVARQQILTDALAFRQFEAAVKEEEAWICERLPLASSINLGQDESSVTRLQQQNTALRNAADQHQSSAIEPLAAKGEELLGNSNASATDISAYVASLAKLWASLQAHIARRTNALDNALFHQQFESDATAAESWLAENEQQILNAELGKDTFAAQNLLRLHRAVGREVANFENSVLAIAQRSEQVQDVPAQLDPGTTDAVIHATAKAAFSARSDRELSVKEGEILELVKVKDVKWWKMRRVSGSAEGYVPAAYVTRATPSAPSSLQSNARARAASIVDRHAALVAAVEQHQLQLGEAIAYFSFCFEADELETWLDDKQQTAGSAEIGQDYEQNEQLMKKFDLFKADVESNSNRIAKLRSLAAKLVEQRHTKSASITAREDKLDAQWQQLLVALENRNAVLLSATEITQFGQSVAETCGWMESKLSTMSNDAGHDVGSVQHLLRLHDKHLAGLAPIQQQIETISSESERLAGEHPEHAETLSVSCGETEAAWADFEIKTMERKQLLTDAMALQQFLADSRDFGGWLDTLESNIVTVTMPEDVMSAESAIQLLSVHRAELTHPARNSAFTAYLDVGQSLVDAAHYASDQIAETLLAVQDKQLAVTGTWELQSKNVAECRDLCAWRQEFSTLSLWIDKQDVVLEDNELGDSLEAVEGLLRRHTDFMDKLQGFAVRFVSLDALGKTVEEHSDACAELIAGLPLLQVDQEAIRAREVHLLSSASNRGALLKDSFELQRFLRQREDTRSWIAEQLAQALEPSYNDSTMLPASTQRHDLFMSTLLDFETEIEAIREAAGTMVAAGHVAAETIQAQVEELNTDWAELVAQSTDKHQKLKEAMQEWNLKHLVTDILLFCEDIASFLKSTDFGQDATSAELLLRRCEARDDALTNKSLDLEELGQLAESLCAAGHFRSDAIMECNADTMNAYVDLAEPMTSRLTELRQSYEFQTFSRSVQEGLAWIEAIRGQAESLDFSSELSAASRLLREHTVVDDQINGYFEQLACGPLDVGAQLVEAGHPASTDIGARVEQLCSLFEELQGSSQLRLDFLQDMEKVAKFLVDVADAEDVIETQRQRMDAQDKGADAVGVAAAIVEHASLRSDVEGHAVTVARLGEQSNALLESGHEASNPELFAGAITVLQTSFADLQDTMERHALGLEDNLRWHQYSNKVVDAREWIISQEERAGATDIGKDSEECDLLLEQFGTFKQQIDGFMAKRHDELVDGGLALAEGIGERVIDGNHIDPDDLEIIVADIMLRKEGLTEHWGVLVELIAERNVLLSGANEIHTFYRDVEDVRNRIADKNVKAERSDYGKDLEVVQALLREHAVFQSDLDALEMDVQSLGREGVRLLEAFPAKKSGLAERVALIDTSWVALQEQTADRKVSLDRSHEYHKFAVRHGQVIEWIDSATRTVREQVVSEAISEAETVLSHHKKLRAEIDARLPDLSEVLETGADLCARHAFLLNQIQPMLETLQNKQRLLNGDWAKWHRIFDENLEHLAYDRDFHVATAELKHAEERLAAADIDDGELATMPVQKIEEWINHVDDLKRSVAANSEKLRRLQLLTKAERVELGTEAIERYEEEVLATQQRRAQHELEAASKMLESQAKREKAVCEAEEQRKREEVARAQERKEHIAARALSRQATRQMKKRVSEETSNRRATEAALRRDCAVTTGDQMRESPSVPRKIDCAPLAEVVVVIDDLASRADEFPASTLTPLNSNGSPTPSREILVPDTAGAPLIPEIIGTGLSRKRLTSQSSLSPGSPPETPPGSLPGTPPGYALNTDSDESM